MGTIFIAGTYGVGKSTLCDSLSKKLDIPAFSSGDLISNVNGEKYGANKFVKNKSANQDILEVEVKKLLKQFPKILLAGHFCIFNKFNCIEKLPYDIFEKINIEQILLLETEPLVILQNLKCRDKKTYDVTLIEQLIFEERKMAETISQRCACEFHIHQMSYDLTDQQKCVDLLNN